MQVPKIDRLSSSFARKGRPSCVPTEQPSKRRELRRNSVFRLRRAEPPKTAGRFDELVDARTFYPKATRLFLNRSAGAKIEASFPNSGYALTCRSEIRIRSRLVKWEFVGV